MAKRKNIVGNRVASARVKAGMTQADLSQALARARIKIGRAGIAKIELGMRQVADYELIGLAQALGVTVNWLLKT